MRELGYESAPLESRIGWHLREARKHWELVANPPRSAQNGFSGYFVEAQRYAALDHEGVARKLAWGGSRP